MEVDTAINFSTRTLIILKVSHPNGEPNTSHRRPIPNPLNPPLRPPVPLSFPQPPTSAARKLVASAVGVAGDDNDVQMGDEEDEQNSRAATTSTAAADKVEESMRGCFIQNKRPKRALSPSAVVMAEQRRSWENEGLRDGAVVAEYDPNTNKLRSLGLIYQSHG